MEVGRLGRVGAAVHRGNVLEIRRSGLELALTQNLMPTEHIVLDLMPNVLTAQVNIPIQLTFIYLKSLNKICPFPIPLLVFSIHSLSSNLSTLLS